MKLLGERVFNLDRLDQIVQGFAGTFPRMKSASCLGALRVPGDRERLQHARERHLPFFRRIDQDDARLHTVRINGLHVFLEVFELFHGLSIYVLAIGIRLIIQARPGRNHVNGDEAYRCEYRNAVLVSVRLDL